MITRRFLALLALVAACSPDADADDCAGAPFGPGFTWGGPGPLEDPDKDYTREECERFCGLPMTCAPTIEQRGHARIRCGAPPPSHCGPEHQPRR